MKVIDDFLPKAYQNVIENTLLGDMFPWFFNPTTCGKDHPNANMQGVFDTYHFTHNMLTNGKVNSEYFNLVQPIMYNLMLVEGIDTSNLLRIKANLTLKSNYLKDTFAPPHTDFQLPQKINTCIYYVNDSDGDTLFFDSDYNIVNKVSPKKGRLVYFDSGFVHAKKSPQKNNTRCVLNFNFEVKENTDGTTD
jgi:hypothetical protein